MRRSLFLTATTVTAAALGGTLLASPAAAAHGQLVITGLTAGDRLVTFKANDPGTLLSEVKVRGLGEGEDLQGIDFRPKTGALYGVATSDAGGRVYTIDPASGQATPVAGAPTLPVSGDVSIDVNPAADALRIVDSTGTNLRLRFSDLVLFPDGRLSYVAGDPAAGSTPQIAGVAYTNNDNKPETPTTLFDIDAALQQLVKQDPPNAGGLVTVAPLDRPTKAQATGFDVYTRESNGVNWAFVSFFDRGRTTFYEIDLATGKSKVFAPNPADPASGTQIASRPHVTDLAVKPFQGV